VPKIDLEVRKDINTNTPQEANPTSFAGLLTSFVAIEPCQSYSFEEVYQTVRQLFSHLGGLAQYVKSGDRVLLKPNMLAAQAPDKAIVTHPTVVEVVTRMVQELGGYPIIGDSPGGIVGGIQRYWDATGLTRIAKRTGAQLVSFETSKMFRCSSNGSQYYLTKILQQVDVIINLPKLKTHNLMLFTGAVKNMYGVLPGYQKTEFHKHAPHPQDFAKVLLDIYQLSRPHLHLMDAVVGMEGDGPSNGTPRPIGYLLASTDGVALDTIASYLIGFNPATLPTIREAKKRNLGQTKISSNVSTLQELKLNDFKLPSNFLLQIVPKPLVDIFKPLVWVRPKINEKECTRCKTCIRNCPVKAMRLDSDTLRIDYKMCIKCFCCSEICPAHAISLEKSWLARLFVNS